MGNAGQVHSRGQHHPAEAQRAGGRRRFARNGTRQVDSDLLSVRRDLRLPPAAGARLDPDECRRHDGLSRSLVGRTRVFGTKRGGTDGSSVTVAFARLFLFGAL